MYQKLAERLAEHGYNLEDYDNDPRKCGILADVALCFLAREIREKRALWEWESQEARRRNGGAPSRGKGGRPGPANANRVPLQQLEGGGARARARILRRGRLEISVLNEGHAEGVNFPLCAPEREVDTFGAALLLALDTEYQECRDDEGTSARRNDILSYQVMAVTEDGRWCEAVYHVRDGHRMSLGEIIDETRRILDLKVAALKKREVRVVTHYGVAEWAALRDRDHLAPVLQLIRKIPITLAPHPVKLRMNNRAVAVQLSVADTMLLAPETKKSLAALGEVVGIPKVELPKGAIERMAALRDEDRDLFEEYGINDARITLAYYLKMCRVARDELGLEKVPSTTGAMSVATFVNSMDEYEYLRMFGLKKVKYYRKTRIEPCEYRELMEPLFRQGFAGGLNNATPGIVRPGDERVVLDIDFTSAYPTAASLLPVVDWSGKGTEMSEFKELAAVDGGTAISISCALVDFDFPPGEGRPCIPIRHTKYGLIYPRTGRGFATGPELRLARAKGAQIRIVRQEFLPHLVNADDGMASLAFAPFLGRMVEKRNTFPKKSLEGETYKLICNTFYGKLAQGLRDRVVTSFDNRVSLPDSAVTCAGYVTMITGIVRTALIELQDAIEEMGGIIHSATTDGCAASFPIPADQVASLEDIPGFWEAVLDKPGVAAMRLGLLNMNRPGVPLELKAIGDSCEIWKTRGYVIRRAGCVKHSGRAGHQLSPDEMSERAQGDEIGHWTMRSLAGVQKIYEGKVSDVIRLESKRKDNLDYDFKQIPDGKGGYLPPATLDEFLDWREAAETIRKSGQRASETRVRLNLARINPRGGQETAVRRMFLRAIAQDIAGVRPPGVKDRAIAEAVGMTGDDMKNAKRRPYQPLPDLPEIREIIEGMLATLGMEGREIPVELLSQVHPEA